MKTSDLEPAAYNPRRISKEAKQGLKASIDRFGLVQPIIWNARTNRVVGGHQRLDVLLEDGVKDVDVVVVDLPESEEKALNVALNSPAISGEFTEELDALLEEIRMAEPALFDDLMLEQLIDLGVGETKPGETGRDSVPSTPVDAKSALGETYTLGRHKLLCGDATKLGDVEALMAGRKAALVATDPPYLVDYTGVRPNDSGKDWSESYREIEIKDAAAFFRTTFENVLHVLAPNAAIYCWHAHKRCGLIQKVWEDLDILDHQQIIWVKPTPVFGRVFHHFRHEPAMMGWRRGSKPPHDGKHDHDSVWEVDWEGAARIVGNEHPTQKPVELFARPIRKHTRKGDVCFEPFAGSGSQLIAAEETGRKCFAMEIEPVFCDVVRRRWAEYVHGEDCDWEGLTPSAASRC